MSSIHMGRNPIFHIQTKHIDVHYHFIWECALARDDDARVDNQHIHEGPRRRQTVAVHDEPRSFYCRPSEFEGEYG